MSTVEDQQGRFKLLTSLVGDGGLSESSEGRNAFESMLKRYSVPDDGSHDETPERGSEAVAKIVDRASPAAHVASVVDSGASSGGGSQRFSAMSRLQSPRYCQVRLPVEVADRIMFADVDSMKTLTRFYLINKGTKDVPKPALLDQLSLVTVLKILVPTMHMKVALALSINILTQYGHNADLNNDGVISPTEWEALQKVMGGLDHSRFSQPTATASKSRLVTLMLR